MRNLTTEYTAVFTTSIDEKRSVETIDAAWMAETAPAEYEKASAKHSDYLGCTYKEAMLRDIYPRAMAWFACEGNEAEATADGMGTGNARFDNDLLSFFAGVQANAYCKALQDGADGKSALEAASDALYMVAEPYRTWMADWNEDIEA